MTRAERVMWFIEEYLIVPEGAKVGMPIKLAPFQELFIRAVYDNPAGTRRAYLSKARKNSKTATIACLLLAHLVGPEAKLNSQIQSGAMSREQAAQVFKYARKMVELSEELSNIVRIVPSGKRLIGTPLNVEYQAMASDSKTAHGGSPILAILDEVGQVSGPQSDFIDAIETSQGAYEAPLLIVISTQAANDADLFSIWLDDAERSQDPKIVSHLYTTPKEYPLMDKASWKMSNPALGLFRSLADVEEQAKRAVRMPSSENKFRNLTLNQRVTTVSTLFSADAWKKCGGAVLDFGDTEVYAGLDLSERTDLTAFVMIARIAGVWHVKAHFWTPELGIEERAKRDRAPYDMWARQGYLHTTPGATVDYDFVAQDIATLTGGINLQTIGYDRHRIDDMNKACDRVGIELPLLEFGQGFVSMGAAVDNLEAEVLNGRLAHGLHPVLTMCAVNATTIRDSTGNRKLEKSKKTGRIDGIVALANAVGIATKFEKEPEKAFQLFMG